MKGFAAGGWIKLRTSTVLLAVVALAARIEAQSGGQSAPPPNPPAAPAPATPDSATPAPAAAPVADQAPASPPLHAAPFPGLQPFKQSRFWELATEAVRQQGLTPSALHRMDDEFGILRSAKADADKLVAEMFGTKVPRDLLLGTKVPEPRRIWFWQVPIVPSRLAPLWIAAEWDEAQFETARVAATFFAQQDDPPKLDFVQRKHAENHAQLEALAAWFRTEVARTESYALMIITDDDGPWLPVEAKPSGAKESSARHLDAERRLVIARKSGESAPWLLQLHAGKKVSWTRALTQVPANSVLGFTEAPEKLGDYGWIVHMTFGEYTALYLDARAQPLFYFTSW